MEYHCDDADYGCLVFASFVGGRPHTTGTRTTKSSGPRIFITVVIFH